MPVLLPQPTLGGRAPHPGVHFSTSSLGRAPPGVHFASSTLSEDDDDDDAVRRPAFKMARTFAEEAELDPEWDAVRTQLAQFFHNGKFEMGLACALLLNILLVWIQIDSEAERAADAPQLDGAPGWVIGLNSLLLVIYAAELMAKLYVYRLMFFTNAFSVAELVLVVLDIFMMIAGAITGGSVPSMSIVRIFRLTKLARATRVIVLFPELHLMVKGLKGAINAILWSCLLVSIVLFSWSFLFVQVVHPLNLEVAETGAYEGCSRCAHAYESVMQSFLTFTQQVIAGDSWGMMTVPLIERYPWTYALFMGVLVTVSFAIMNLMLAVIVDSAQEARKLSDYELALERDRKADLAKAALMAVCAEIDVNKNGTLSLQELLDGYDTNGEFHKAMSLMDISKNDMGIVFRIMDTNNSGDVDYFEFINELHRMKSHGIHTMLIFIKHYVTELDQKMTNVIKASEQEIIEHLPSQAALGPETEPKGTASSKVIELLHCQDLQVKDGSARPDAAAVLRRAHEELVAAMQDIVERFGLLLRQQQAADSIGGEALKAAAPRSNGALQFGTLPRAPAPPVRGSGEGPPRLSAAEVADGVELALPPWPRESRPKAQACCAYAETRGT